MKTSKAPKERLFFTTHDIARMTGTDPSTVHKWLEKGLLRASRTPGGHRRVRSEDLRGFLRSLDMPLPKELGGGSPVRVLAVDDDEALLKSTQKVLKKLRPTWDVITVTSGVEALLQLESIAPDLVLLDLFMPEIDGFAVTKQLKARPATQNVKVLAMTARDSADVERKAVAAGAVAVMKKPIDGQELVAVIETTLRLQPMANG